MVECFMRLVKIIKKNFRISRCINSIIDKSFTQVGFSQ